jgi:Zn-dependent peptidase ImmA (M78 family)
VFERGFKTWCEKYSVEKRKTLGLAASAPLDTVAFAKHLGVRVWTPRDVSGVSADALAVLLRNDGVTPSCWSAVTLVVGNKVVVILNSSHSPARQASDLTHELAHYIRSHEAQEVAISEQGLMLLKSYDKVQEEEADWLSGCLLLPREALISIRRRRLADELASAEYGVSMKMLNYRMSMTGVNRQFA